MATIRNEKAKLLEDAKAVLNSYKIDIPEVLNQALENPIENFNNEETNMKEIAKLPGLPENAIKEQIQNAIEQVQAQVRLGNDALMGIHQSQGLRCGCNEKSCSRKPRVCGESCR